MKTIGWIDWFVMGLYLDLFGRLDILVNNAGVSSFEAVGLAETVQSSFDLTAAGGTLVIIGNLAKEFTLPLQLVTVFSGCRLSRHFCFRQYRQRAMVWPFGERRNMRGCQSSGWRRPALVHRLHRSGINRHAVKR